MREDVEQKIRKQALLEIGNIINVKFTMISSKQIVALKPEEILLTPEYHTFKKRHPNLCKLAEGKP